MVTTRTTSGILAVEHRGRLYPHLLGEAWHALAPAVQRVHADPSLRRAEGAFEVRRGPGRLAGLLLDAARVPRPAQAAEVRLVIRERGAVEVWQRSIGGGVLATVQRATPDRRLAERIGLLEFRLRLAVEGGALRFHQEQLALCVGPLRITLPRRVAIQVSALEEPADGSSGVSGAMAGSSPVQTRVAVRVTTARGGLLFSYRGVVRWLPEEHDGR